MSENHQVTEPTDRQPPEESLGGVSPESLSRHENTTGVSPEDSLLVAHFAKAIGNELYTVDSRSVGSSGIKALKLDQEKIFSSSAVASPQPSNPQPVTQPVVSNNATSVVSSPRKAPPPPLHSPSDDISDISKRLSRCESSIKALRNAKKIKRGLEYSVSSNSFKGVIKDASLLAEYIISEVAKGVNTITIRRNDSKDKK
jgi:hypothetical protein